MTPNMSGTCPAAYSQTAAPVGKENRLVDRLQRFADGGQRRAESSPPFRARDPGHAMARALDELLLREPLFKVLCRFLRALFLRCAFMDRICLLAEYLLAALEVAP